MNNQIRMALFIISILCVSYLIYRFINQSTSSQVKDNTKDEPMSPTTNESELENALPPKSCGCPDLVTWHPGQIEHMKKCPIFRKLNPNLTMKQFLNYEGFPINKDQEWPPL